MLTTAHSFKSHSAQALYDPLSGPRADTVSNCNNSLKYTIASSSVIFCSMFPQCVCWISLCEKRRDVFCTQLWVGWTVCLCVVVVLLGLFENKSEEEKKMMMMMQRARVDPTAWDRITFFFCGSSCSCFGGCIDEMLWLPCVFH
mgnify:CR=1 FL=1